MREGQSPETFLVCLLAALASGILAGRAFSVPVTVLFPALAISLIIAALLLYRSSRWTFVPVALLFFMLGMLRFGAVWQLPADDVSTFARETVRVVGELADEPDIGRDAEGVAHARYTVAVREVRAGGRTQDAAGKMYLYERGDRETAEAARIGDTVVATAKIRLPRGYRDPGQLDTAMLLRADGITATGSVTKGALSVEPEAGHSFLRWVQSVRAHYREGLLAVMPAEDAAAIFAMLFGGYRGIDEDVVDSFTATGIVHILSVSGSHVSLLAAALAYLGLLLRLPKVVTAGIVMAAIAVYCVLSGCVPPALRAGVMGSLAFLAVALGRERAAGHLFLLTGLVMLLVQPLLLFHISFQLSFLATAGLLYLAPPFARWMRARGVPSFLALGLSVTLGAQLSTLPFLLWYFGQVSVSSLLANLVIVPVIDIIIIVALIAGIVAFFLPILGTVFFAMASLLFGLVRDMAKLLASLPCGLLYLPAMPLWLSSVYYAGLVLLVLPEEKRQWLVGKLRPQAGRLAVLLAALLIFFAAREISRPDELAVHFIDVGQGDAALVVTPHGHAFLFDTGGTRDGAFDVGKKVDVPYLLHYGIHRIDGIFLTHAHEDHAAGTAGVMKKIPTDRVYTAGEGVYAYARSMRVGDGDPRLRRFEHITQGKTLTVDGVTIETIYAPEVADAKENEASNVYRVTYGDASFLFTGDLVKEHEAKMLEEGVSPECTVLKVGHHGSDTSTSEDFLRAAAPAYAVIEVGADNSFGHPKPSVVERLRAADAEIYRTDEDGAIVFHTDGKTIRVETFEE